MSIPEWRNWQTRTTQNREEKSVSVRPRLRGPWYMKSTDDSVLFFDSIHLTDKPEVVALHLQYFSHDNLSVFSCDFDESHFLIKAIRTLVIEIIPLV